MPVMIETERLQIQDQQKAQKNQMLFGTGIEKVLKQVPMYQVVPSES